MRELTQLKQVFPEYKEVHVHVLPNVIKKIAAFVREHVGT